MATNWSAGDEITAAKLNDTGYNTRVAVYLGSLQKIATGVTQNSRVRFDTKRYDPDNAFDNAEKSGTADATEALKLHDADGGFEAGDVGKIVWNTTDETYAKITGFVDSGELTLDTDIMANGEGYIIFNSKYTAPATGYYLVICQVYLKGVGDQNKIRLDIYVNDTRVRYVSLTSSNDDMSIVFSDILSLTANDEVHFEVSHSMATDLTIEGSDKASFFSIHRIS